MWMYVVSHKKCHDEFLTININTYRVTPAPPICTRWDLMVLRIFLIFVLTRSLSRVQTILRNYIIGGLRNSNIWIQESHLLDKW